MVQEIECLLYAGFFILALAFFYIFDTSLFHLLSSVIHTPGWIICLTLSTLALSTVYLVANFFLDFENTIYLDLSKKRIIWVSIVHSDTWLLMVFDLNVDYWRKLVTMAILEGICSHTLYVMSFSFMNTVSSVYCIQYSVLTPDFTLLTLESWLSIILTLNSQLSTLGSWLLTLDFWLDIFSS